MRRLLGILAALAALLAFAPAALAANYVVNLPGDDSDFDVADAGFHCDIDNNAGNGDQCTLRAAIEQANATNAVADTITFSAHAPNPLASLPPVTDRLQIDGGGNTTVTFGPAAVGPLLWLKSPDATHAGGADSVVRAIAFTGGASGPVIRIDPVRVRLDTVTVRDAAGAGVVVNGADARLDSPTITHLAQQGLVLTGARTTVTSPEIAANGSDGLSVTGSGANISNGRIHDNSGTGVVVDGQNDVIDKVTFFGNRDKPVALVSGANGGIAPPQDLRIGPRRSDGSVPLTGSSSGGSIELWQGDPASATAPGLLGVFGASPGEFSYSFATEPQPGQEFSLKLNGGSGSSEFTKVVVPADLNSPDIARARALSTSVVRVVPTEPLDAASVQKEDFSLFMAGQGRAIDSATVAPDGTYVDLASSGWRAGEAGYVETTSAGALSDSAGNASLATTRLRVAAAPGDFIPPLGGSLRLSPRVICLTHGRGCPRTGTNISFVTSEPGKARIVVQRGNRRIGTRLYSNVTAGKNTLKFNGRLGSRKLRAGRYRMLLFVQDAVGNVTDQPPITLFDIRRVTK